MLTGAHADEPDPLPNEHTVFRIASMTKSFTAASILILRDRGLLRLDDIVADIAPEFAAVVGPTSDSPPITIRHLLSMAGGMATDDVWADRHLDISDDELDVLLGDGATFAWTPGVHGEYSNLGFAMLGRIILRVSGQRPQDFITEHLLRELAMDRTTWVQPDHDEWARPYEVVDDRPRRRHRSIGGWSDRAYGRAVVVRFRPGEVGGVVRATRSHHATARKPAR